MGTGSLLALGAAALAAGALVLALGAPDDGSAPTLAVGASAEETVVEERATDLPRHRAPGERGAPPAREAPTARVGSWSAALPGPSPAPEGMEWSLNGVVVDRAGMKPAYAITCRGGGFHAETTSDELGGFQLWLPGAGDYWFTVEAPGRRLVTHRSVRAAGDFLRLEFEGSHVVGRVVDPQGAPLEDVDVRLEWRPDDDEASTTHFPTQARTDDLGRFVFEYVPEGRFRLVARPHQQGELSYEAVTGEAFVVDGFSLPEEHVLRLPLAANDERVDGAGFLRAPERRWSR